VIGQAAKGIRPKKPILIFLSARVRKYTNRLGDENISSLTVSECGNGRFKCSQIELRNRARECIFDEIAICYEILCQRREFIQVLEQQEAPGSSARL
jgi:hypothetical protein